MLANLMASARGRNGASDQVLRAPAALRTGLVPHTRPELKSKGELAAMAEWLAGTVSDFEDNHRRILTVNNREIVVFEHKGGYYALDNTCLHMGGPVGEGLILGK